MLDTSCSTRLRTTTEATGGAGALRISEADLRAFYDPAGHRDGRPARDLLDDVAASRAPSVLPGAGTVTGHEVVLAEALHAGLGTDPRVGVPLPVPPERRRAVTRAVDRQADTVARAVTGLADDLARRSRRRWLRVRGPHPSPPDRLVFAGRVLAAVAHDGVVRRNGRAYYSHPDEVAGILTAAWPRRVRPAPDARLQTVRFLAYCHDAFEEVLDPAGRYLGAPVLVSPRVALAVLERLRVPDAAAVARILLLMTRTRATDGSRMPYLDHVERGIREGGAFFVLTKAGDIHHNLNIEPEDIDRQAPQAPARRHKRELYRLAVARLDDAADRYDPDTARAVHDTFAVRRSELPPTPPTDAGHLRLLAAAVRDRVG